MTLTNPNSVYTYTPSSQSEEEFPFPNLFFKNTDLNVTITDATGNITTAVETVDYTVSGAGNPAGGTVKWIGTSPDSSNSITIARWVDLTQEADYPETGTFPAEAHEKALDRLTMQTQQIAERTGGSEFSSGTLEALRRSQSNVEEWDAKSGKIVNAANPTNAQDVATKAYADTVATGTGDLPPVLNPGDDLAVLQANGGTSTWVGVAVPQPVQDDADNGRVLTAVAAGESKGGVETYQWLDVSLPTANVVINGGMRIQQRRAVELAQMVDGVFVIDRWHHQMEVQNSISITQQNLPAAGQTGPDLIPPGAYSAMQLTYGVTPGGGSGKHALITFLESRDVADIIKDGGGNCSISFKARKGPSTGPDSGNIRAAVCQWQKDASTDNIDERLVQAWNAVGTAPTLNNGWSYVTSLPPNPEPIQDRDLTIDQTWQTFRLEDLQFNDADTRNVAVIIWYDGDDLLLNDSWLVTEVQLLPVPKAAARFEYKSLGEERGLCERYYEASFKDGIFPATGGLGPVTDAGREIFMAGFATSAPGSYQKVGFRTTKFVPFAGLGVKVYSPGTGAAANWRKINGTGAPVDEAVSPAEITEHGFEISTNVNLDPVGLYAYQWACTAELGL